MPTLADMPAQCSSHDYVRMGRELAREACVGSATAALLAPALGFALAAMSSTRHAFTWAARAIAHVYRREVAAKLAGLHARRSGTRAADPPACQPAHPRSSTSQRPYRPGVDGSDGGRRRLGDEGSKGDTSAQPLREADFAMVRRDLDRNAPVSRKEFADLLVASFGRMRDGQRGFWTGVVGYAVSRTLRDERTQDANHQVVSALVVGELELDEFVFDVRPCTRRHCRRTRTSCRQRRPPRALAAQRPPRSYVSCRADRAGDGGGQRHPSAEPRDAGGGLEPIPDCMAQSDSAGRRGAVARRHTSAG